MIVRDVSFYLKFWVKLTALEQNSLANSHIGHQ